MTKKHYGSIAALRTIAVLGILMMHMKENNSYEIHGFIYEKIIPSFTDFVFLFMTVSAFGMCCGYYDKVIQNRIAVGDFYSRRFERIWPFFAGLVVLDLVLSLSSNAFYEAFADLTLLFGLLPAPNKIAVIGVGWFIGTVFVFYLIFPFFCWLLESKRRGWMTFGISLLWNIACVNYFDVERQNILYSGCFFLAGGLIYLYRNEIERMNSRVVLVFVIVSIAVYYLAGANTVTRLFVSAMLLIYAVILGDTLENRVTRFFGGISMELYLSHMVIFRGLEKLHVNTMLGNGWLQYLVTTVMVLIGASVFGAVMQRLIEVAKEIKW